MQNTRNRILDFLNNKHQATALEMSRFFQMTPANIRHHLNVLEKDNKIEIVGQTDIEGRGRPNSIYMPIKQSSEIGLANLATALFGSITDHRSDKQKEKQLRKISTHLVGEEPPKDKSVSLQLGFAVNRLNELGYESHWEAHSDSPKIFLGQCPYSELEDHKPDLCQMDTYLIENLVNNKVKMIEKCSRKPGESTHCVFKLTS